MPEIWRAISGYPGYEVSSYGRVRSKDRYVLYRGDRWNPTRTHMHRRAGRMLALCANQGGYPHVVLCKDGVTHTTTVHRLVMQAFVGPCPQGQETRHLDGNSSNNRLGNLAYGTKRENAADRIAHGTAPIGERNAQAILTEPQVVEILARLATGAEMQPLADEFGVGRATVYQIKRGALWPHIQRPE